MDKANEILSNDANFEFKNLVGGAQTMTFEQFSASVLRFESRVDAPRVRVPRVIVLDALAAFEKITDVLDMIKKAIFYGKPIDAEEIGRSARHATFALETLVHQHDFESLARFEAPPLLSAITSVQEQELNMRAMHALLGYCTEAGEISGALSRSIINRTAIDRVNVDEEFADGDWYKAVWFDVTQQTHGETLRRVSDKLVTRYGDKPYSDAAALNRNLPAEREQLERRPDDGTKTELRGALATDDTKREPSSRVPGLNPSFVWAPDASAGAKNPDDAT